MVLSLEQLKKFGKISINADHRDCNINITWTDNRIINLMKEESKAKEHKRGNCLFIILFLLIFTLGLSLV